MTARTPAVAQEVASSVKQLKEIGRKAVDTFIEDRIISDKVRVFSPLARINTVTFATQCANRNKEKKTPNGHFWNNANCVDKSLWHL